MIPGEVNGWGGNTYVCLGKPRLSSTPFPIPNPILRVIKSYHHHHHHHHGMELLVMSSYSLSLSLALTHSHITLKPL